MLTVSTSCESHQLRCEHTLWAPRDHLSNANPLALIHRPVVKFSQKEDCVAAMCVPRCSKSAPSKGWPSTRPSPSRQLRGRRSSVGLQLSPLQKKLPGPNLHSSPIGLQISGSEFKQLEEMKAILGPGAEVLFDSDGQVIGVTAHSDMTPDTSSRPKPQSGDSGNWPQDDASTCCSTQAAFFVNSTLVDYFGVTQTIAQHNQVGAYQFIHHGFCGKKGGCTGECDQIYVTVSLAIHPPKANQQYSFQFFKVPGYCTCRVVAAAQRFAMKGNMMLDTDSSHA
ncbi:hypothetical protein PoB_004116100 [Plakobranchus ocellatus]|uniref:Spaetzle domain-containing protein n=1 Tax=Plakobranchus ocellatus TaxID=259542 RepID=A0AAV4B767_9GAST|nr:hypothetical protein PoB_004116100 [Plakobranchus ocellatus]